MIIAGVLVLWSTVMDPVGGTAHFAHLGGMLFGYAYLTWGRGGPMAEIKYRYTKWRMARLRRQVRHASRRTAADGTSASTDRVASWLANREASGLAALRVLLGVFFVAEGLTKYAWLFKSEALAARLASGRRARTVERVVSAARRHPRTRRYFARLVVIGELACGVALLLGVSTRPAAVVGALHGAQLPRRERRHLSRRLSHRTATACPSSAALLALGIGAGRLPWSLRG